MVYSQMEQFRATNGVTYVPGRSQSWGSRGCPLVPRAYREIYGKQPAPSELSLFFKGRTPFLADLGTTFWSHNNVDRVPERVRRQLGIQLSRLPIPLEALAIPAGFPSEMLSKMPFQVRARTALRRLVRGLDEEKFHQSLLLEHVLDLQGVGIQTALDILCVLESAELRNSDLQVMDPGLPKPHQDFQGPLLDVAAWARSETDAVTLGDAIRYLTKNLVRVEAWRRLSETPLRDLSPQPAHPYGVIERWADGLGQRDRMIFNRRLAKGKPDNMTALASELGCTRERVRQLTGFVRKDLESFMKTEEGKVVGWRVNTVRAVFGVAVPSQFADEYLAAPRFLSDHSKVVLNLAGPYQREGDWLILASERSSDPTRSILEEVDAFGRVDLLMAYQRLGDWGLRRGFHQQWLIDRGKCRRFDRELVKWNVSVVEKLHYALHKMGKPQSAQQLLGFLGEESSATGAKNSMSADDRFIRTSIKEWALSDWGFPEYRGIALSIKDMLEAAGGSMQIDDVVERMHEVYSTSRQSATAYCHAPLFVMDGETVRLRHEGDSVPLADIPTGGVSGLFRLGENRFGILVEVGRDVLRGSGRSLGIGASLLLRLLPGESRTFEDSRGVTLKITYPETSITGPALGSIREIANGWDAKHGDWLTLVLDGRDCSFTSTVTIVDEHAPSWGLVERLTGVDGSTGMSALADALNCDVGEARKVLISRGESVVLNAVPWDGGLAHSEKPPGE